ncbi:MAG: biotin transporter BioY [Candidatus Limnocylindria bacterium]|nr:biotin transporter BioY [Candidatus Limnocylindria bacterium]
MHASARTLAVALIPDRLFARALLAVGGTLLLALSAQVAVPLPFSPVPVTGQTFAVLLIGAALGARLGAATVLLYLAEGVAGLPVFTPGATIGVARLAGPTGGYLAGFVVAAFVVGLLAERGWDRRVRTAALAMLAGEAVIYAIALPSLARFVPAERLLDAGLWPFVAGDLYKLALAALALPVAWRVARA